MGFMIQKFVADLTPSASPSLRACSAKAVTKALNSRGRQNVSGMRSNSAEACGEIGKKRKRGEGGVSRESDTRAAFGHLFTHLAVFKGREAQEVLGQEVFAGELSAA